MNACILLPTLNRVELLKRFLQSYRDTKATVEVAILVDSKDREKNKAAYDSLDLPANCAIVETGHFVSMGDKVRSVWDSLESMNYDWIGILNDDHVCLTEEWDKRTDELIDGTNMVSTNDGSWNFGFNVVGLTAWSTPLLRAAGFPIFPNGIDHWFIDNVWKSIGEKTGCWHETIKINIEHRHVFCGKMEADDTYKVSQNQAKAQMAAEAFDRFLREDFPSVCERIDKLREGETKRAKFA